jgi:transcriptional regulator with XRE-family HTH domain
MADVGGIGGRVKAFRRRRGMSQERLAHLVGRSESWLSQVERGIRPVENLAVLTRLAEVLDVEIDVLAGQPLRLAPPAGAPVTDEVAAIRDALSGYAELTALLGSEGDRPLRDLRAVSGEVAEAWSLRHRSLYGRLGHVLPSLIGELEAAASRYDGDDRSTAYALLSDVYQIARAMLRATGETELAWIAGDRAFQAARLAGDPLQLARVARAMALVFLAQGRMAQATDLAVTAAAALEPGLGTAGPDRWAVWGSLVATAAVVAARKNEAVTTVELLGDADRAAGVVHAARWTDPRTGFGVANVGVHRVSVAVEPGEPLEAQRQAGRVDFSTLPDQFAERRAALHIDVARALGQQRDVGAAVLHLLEAERIAPEEVRHHVLVRELVRCFLKRERRRLAVPELRPLAERLGVTA